MADKAPGSPSHSLCMCGYVWGHLTKGWKFEIIANKERRTWSCSPRPLAQNACFFPHKLSVEKDCRSVGFHYCLEVVWL